MFNANKISLNISKIKIVLFRSTKSMDFNFKIKLNGNGLYETNSVKYTGIRIDNKLYWKFHIDNIALKLIKPMQFFIKLKTLLILEFRKQFIMLYLCHIFVIHVLFGDRMYAQSIIFYISKESIMFDSF